MHAWKHGIQIIRTVFGLARRYNPVLLFSGLVSLAVIPASIILGWIALQGILYGVWRGNHAISGLMLLLLASQGSTVATISLLFRRMEKRIMRQTKIN